MPKVKELRAVALAETAESFAQTRGRFTLVQSPPDPLLQKISLSLAGSRTVTMAHRSRLAERLFAMLKGFDALDVIFLHARQDGQVFKVGRVPGMDVVVNEPSVSKHHATFTYRADEGSLHLRDERSTNGSFLNTQPLYDDGQLLHDGDSLAFGDAQFMFLSTATFFVHLRAAS